MTAAKVGGGTARLEPLHQLEPAGDGRWRSTGDDPQFLLHWPPGMDAGPHRIIFALDLPAGALPGVYLDLGEGWAESTWRPLQDVGDGRHWTLVAWLPALPGPARFDPMSSAGPLAASGVRVEVLSEAEVLIEALAMRAAQEPSSAGRLVEEVRLRATRGLEAAWNALVSPQVPESGGYPAWVEAHDTLTPATTRLLRGCVPGLPRRPLVSLLLPLGKLEPAAVDACIRSVRAQIYPDWELLALPDATMDQAVADVLQAHAAACSRVRCAAAATAPEGDALDACRGAWIGVLDGAVRLAPHALLAHVEALLRRPDAVLVYGDADLVGPSGQREAPYFKPDWNPELNLSQDLAGPFALYRAGALRGAAGGGSDDVAALARQASLDLPAESVVHVPLVLAHLPVATPDADAPWRPRAEPRLRALPDPLPSVALVIPTRDRAELLSRCLDRILLSGYPRLSVVVVDNQSEEEATHEYFARIVADPRVTLLAHDAPFNYAAINNAAVRQLDAEVVGLLNNDIEPISDDWLEQMVRHAVQPDVGAVGAMLYYPDDTIQHAGVIVGLGGVAGHALRGKPRGAAGPHGRARQAQALSAVTAACMLVRRAVYLQAGGLDESLAVAFNDVDFCLRLQRLGYRNVWTPHAELYHHESASRGTEDTLEKQARFRDEVEAMRARWDGTLGVDPAYHPALSLETGCDFALAQVPRYALADLVSAVEARAGHGPGAARRARAGESLA